MLMNSRIAFTSLLLLFICFSLSAQEKQTQWSHYESDEGVKEDDVLHELSRELGLDVRKDFSLFKQKNKNELSHSYYQQLKNEIPIENNFVNIHAKNGIVFAASHKLSNSESIEESVPLVSAEQSIQSAMEHIAAREYTWQNAGYERLLKEIKNDNNYSSYPKPELVYYPTLDQGYKLAYKMEVSSLVPQTKNLIYINAEDAEVLHAINMIHHSCDDEVTSNTHTLNYGNQSYQTFLNTATSEYELHNCSKHIFTHIMPDLSIDYDVADLGTSSNQDFTDFTSEPQAAALTAQWATQVTYDMFSMYGYDSFDDNGAEIHNFVNYGETFKQRDNAFWNGDVLTYGAGPQGTENSSFNGQVVSLDIAAHEYGHAVTQYFSPCGLIYQGESGAINESFSDIISAAVDRYATIYLGQDNIGIDPWIAGELASNTNGMPGLRSFIHPNNYGHPQEYQGAYWWAINPPYNELNDYGGVHYNSSVMNHWFYILAEDINFDMAFTILLESYNYLNCNPVFHDMRMASILASEAIFECTHTQSVVEAWNSVGVLGDPIGGCILNAEIQDPNTQVCTGNPTMYTSNIINPNFSEAWFLDGVATSSEITFSNPGSYTITLEVTDNDPSSNTFEMTATDIIIVNVFDCEPIVDPKGVMYFNNGFGLDFTNGIANTTSYPYKSYEANICQTDPNGEMLFYLASYPSFGKDVGLYDVNDELVVELEPISLSDRQIGASVPSPTGEKYNLILGASHEGGSDMAPDNNGFYRLVIDYDDVTNTISVPSEIEPILPPNNGFSYSTDDNGAIRVINPIVIPGCDNQRFWIIVSTNHSPFHQLVYELDYSTNINGEMVYSHFHEPIANNNFYYVFGVSPQGDKVFQKNILYDFDRTTGELIFDDFLPIGDDPIVSVLYSMQGAFSSDGRYLYRYWETGIHQIDLQDVSESTLIVEFPFKKGTPDLILGPDNKIYFYYKKKTGESSFIGVINYPELSAEFNDLEIETELFEHEESLTPTVFPDYIEAKIPDPSNIEFTTIIENCLDVTVTTEQCLSGIQWDFGDGTIVTGNNQETHSFDEPGTYTVSLTVDLNGSPAMAAQKEIHIGWDTNMEEIEINGPTDFCEGFGYFTAPPNLAYAWSVTNGTPAAISDPNQPFFYVTWGNDSEYTIQLVVTDESGCTQILVQNVVQYCPDPCDPNGIAVPLNGSWNNMDLYINEQIVIPSEHSLAITNSTLRFGDEGSFLVESGGVLVISRSDLMPDSECNTNDEWAGITVEGSGHVSIINYSLIEKARIGLYGTNNSNFVIQVRDSKFLNNRQGIFIENSNDNLLFNIVSNQFYCDVPAFTQIGVMLHNIFIANQLSGNMGIRTNAFTNNGIGVYAVDIHGGILPIVQGNKFEKITFGGILGGNISSELLIEQNVFVEVLNTAIFLLSSEDVTIGRNRIMDVNRIGIGLRNIRAYQVLDNFIISTGAEPLSTGLAIVDNSEAENNPPELEHQRIIENHIAKFTRGIYFNHYEVINQGVQMDCNHLVKMDVGILLEESIINAQGDGNFPVNNYFESLTEEIHVDATSTLGDYHYPTCAPLCGPYLPSIVGLGAYTTPVPVLGEPDCPNTQWKNIQNENIQVESHNLGLNFFPNPSQSNVELEIRTQATDLQNIEIRILDVQGRVMMVLDKELKGTKIINLDVSEFPSGIYWVQVQNSGKTQTEKLVVIK